MKPYRPLTLYEANQLATRIAEFYHRLQNWKIPTPAFFDIKVEDDGAIVEYATDVGEDCYAVLRREPARFDELVSGMIIGSLPLLKIDQRDVGFDSHPANWCVDASSTLTYVDFKPPRLCYDGVHLVGFPQPEDPEDVRIGTWRYYSREGILRRLVFTCERLGPGKGQQTILKTLRTADAECAQWATAYLDTLPAAIVRKNPSLFHAIVKALSPDEVDDLRDLAVVCVECFGAPPDLLEQVLSLSHTSYRKPRADRHAGFEKARSLLLNQRS